MQTPSLSLHLPRLFAHDQPTLLFRSEPMTPTPPTPEFLRDELFDAIASKKKDIYKRDFLQAAAKREGCYMSRREKHDNATLRRRHAGASEERQNKKNRHTHTHARARTRRGEACVLKSKSRRRPSLPSPFSPVARSSKFPNCSAVSAVRARVLCVRDSDLNAGRERHLATAVQHRVL